jgi:poly-gamma-glutamate capsule biosynthesis protein CapA/YwtB (metallophosphatase superfamily)
MRFLKWLAALTIGTGLVLGGSFADAQQKKKPATTTKKAPPKKAPPKKKTPPKKTPVKKGSGIPSTPYTPKYTPNEVKPSIPVPQSDEIVIIGTGDIMMGSTFPDTSGGRLPPEDGAKLFTEVKPYLEAADIAFGNLEGPLIDGGSTGKCSAKSTKCYAFRTPASYGKWLKDAGFDMMSLANNHAMDFGADGRKSTVKALEDLGILYSGEPGTVARMTVKGKKVSMIAFATSNFAPNINDIEGASRLVKEEVAKADIVVVSFHGGGEGSSRQHVPEGQETFLGENRGDLRKFSRAVIDAGADLVLGHGPHVMRGLELYNDRLIVYSMGNFATYGGMNLNGPSGLTAMIEVKLNLDGTFKAGQIHPAKQISPGGPVLDPKGEVITVMQSLTKSDFATTGATINDDGSISK